MSIYSFQVVTKFHFKFSCFYTSILFCKLLSHFLPNSFNFSYTFHLSLLAVKCNPDMVVLKLLEHLGANFDCASKGEIKTILDMGVSPERIIFANPCKQTSYIK